MFSAANVETHTFVKLLWPLVIISFILFWCVIITCNWLLILIITDWHLVQMCCGIDREGNDPGDSSQITYGELLKQVCKFANVLKAKGLSFIWHTTTMALTASDDINNHCLQLGASWLTFPYREGYQRLVRWLKSFKVLLNKVCDSFSVSVGRSKAGLLLSLKHWLYCHTEHHYPMEERIPETSLDRLRWFESCIWLSGL